MGQVWFLQVAHGYVTVDQTVVYNRLHSDITLRDEILTGFHTISSRRKSHPISKFKAVRSKLLDYTSKRSRFSSLETANVYQVCKQDEVSLGSRRDGIYRS